MHVIEKSLAIPSYQDDEGFSYPHIFTWPSAKSSSMPLELNYPRQPSCAELYASSLFSSLPAPPA